MTPRNLLVENRLKIDLLLGCLTGELYKATSDSQEFQPINFRTKRSTRRGLQEGFPSPKHTAGIRSIKSKSAVNRDE